MILAMETLLKQIESRVEELLKLGILNNLFKSKIIKSY